MDPEQRSAVRTGLLLWRVLWCAILFLPGQAHADGALVDTASAHMVSSGETLQKIARQYFPLTEAITVGELVSEIRELNGIEKSMIWPRQRLQIPLSRSTPVSARTVQKKRDFEARGIYANRYSISTSKIRRLIDNMVEPEGNTIILDGKDMCGRLTFPSRVKLAHDIGADATVVVPHPDKLIHYLHERGIHVGVRLVLFFDTVLASARPDLALRSKIDAELWLENGRKGWVDPAHPTVQKYNLDIAKELAAMGVDEIQFDYIRYPTSEDIQDPSNLLGKEDAPRHEIITGFLSRARKELAPFKTLLSIDVFGVMAWGKPEDVRMIGQRIEDLAKHCDVISPMIYPSHFAKPFQGIPDPGNEPFLIVSEACRRFSGFLEGSNVTLRPWIQAFPYGVKHFDKHYVLEQLRALEGSEARGWMLWSAGNMYDIAWKALSARDEKAANLEMVKAPELQLSQCGFYQEWSLPENH